MFADETSISQRPHVTRTWAPRGQTPVIRQCFGWKRISAIVALTTNLQLFFSLKEGSCKGADSAAFLVKLLRAIPGRILLVWDNVGIHRGPEVRALLAEPSVRRRLEILPLPPYAPELNPEELINSQLKCFRLANRSPEDLDQLQRDARGNLLAISRDKEAIKACLLSDRHGLLEERDMVKLTCREH